MRPKPSSTKDMYWIFAHPPKLDFEQNVRNAIDWFENNASNYLKSNKIYPRDIYSNDMITPQTEVEKILLKIDHEAIKFAKSQPPETYHILFGKWLIFIRRERIDEIWNMLSSEIESGRLPYDAKVATAKQNPPNRGEVHVICVYTPNFLFRDDVRNCRILLKKLGFESRLYYKPDIFTYKGMYRVYGSKINHRYFG